MLVGAGGGDNFVRLWEIEGGEARACLSGHAGEVRFPPPCLWPKDVATGSLGCERRVRGLDCEAGGRSSRWPSRQRGRCWPQAPPTRL